MRLIKPFINDMKREKVESEATRLVARHVASATPQHVDMIAATQRKIRFYSSFKTFIFL